MRSGFTLRSAQHMSGLRSYRRAPKLASCSATVWRGSADLIVIGSVAPTASRMPIVSAKW